MKPILLSVFALVTIVVQAQNFIPGNVVVTRVGDGATALSANTAVLNLLEFSSTVADQLTPVKTLAIGSTTTGSRITCSGTTSTEGQLSLSTDASYLCLAGYDASPGELATSTALSNITVGTGGSGYTTSPVATVSAPNIAGGIQATAGTQITAGAVTNIYISISGSGYTATPTITITGGGGSGATAGTISRLAYWQGLSANKVIGSINAGGTVTYNTSFPTLSSGTAKSAVSVNGSAYWTTINRVLYVVGGQTTIPTQVSSLTPRSLSIINNQLFTLSGFSAAALTYSNIALPTVSNTSNGTTAVLPLSASLSAQGFVFFDVDGTIGWNGTGFDVLYISNSTTGIEKYYFDGANWVPVNSQHLPSATPLNNCFNPNGNIGAVAQLTGSLNNSGQPVIYAVTGGGTSTNNKLIAVTDGSGRTGIMTVALSPTITLATAGANYAFRGVAFAPGTNVIILPVSLSSFTGAVINDKSALRWTTSSAVNAREFLIERSNNGISFTTIGTVAAKNGSESCTYQFEDGEPANGINYYRLKLVDKDERFKYSNIVALKSGGTTAIALQVFPNPVISNITIDHNEAGKGAVIKIVSTSGKTVARYRVLKNAVQTGVDASQLAPGIYVVAYSNNGKTSSTTFVK
ncbi:MAG: T9SS type A sorting domain-containing protein [Ferruginibacter sp.]|nr:T9SS type A sorting domain-containing protein [Ferruginibacter sp.]